MRSTQRGVGQGKPERWAAIECSRNCQRALTLKRTLGGGGALERGHGAPLERLAQLGYALGGVGAAATTINAAELVVGQTAEERRCVNGR